MTSTTTSQEPTRGSRLALSTPQLRALLALDAAGCAVLGTVGVVATDALARLLGAGATVVMTAGLALLGYAVVAATVARRPAPRGLLVAALLNVGFAAGTVAVVLAGGLTGYGVTVAGALVVVSLVVADLLLIARRGA